MELRMMALRDAALEAYGRPFFVSTVGQAVRSFMDELANKDSEISKHPADYDLYCLGVYNDFTGVVSSTGAERVARGVDYVSQSIG